jgi:inner membrane transporter RhtA
MALEPAFALVIGLLVLAQVPDGLAVAGIVLVVAAGIGAERSGAREPHAVPAPVGPLEPGTSQAGTAQAGVDLRER